MVSRRDKCILTTALISTMFSEIENKWWIIGVAACAVVLCLVVGVYLLRFNTKKQTTKKR